MTSSDVIFRELPVLGMLLDGRGGIVEINRALRIMIEQGGREPPAPSTPVSELLEVAVGSLDTYLQDLSPPGPLVSLVGDVHPRSFRLSASRIEDGLLAVLVPMQRAPAMDLHIPLRAIEAYLELSKKVNILMREEEVLQMFVQMLHRLFPDYHHCVRLLDVKRGTLGMVYADAPLVQEVRDRVFISPSAFETGAIPESLARRIKEHVEVLDTHPCIFENTSQSLIVALADEENLFGTMHVETDRDSEILPFMRLLCFALGHHLTSALRNARLLGETLNLKDHLTKLIDHANAPIVIIDGKRRIGTINRALEQLTGYTKDDLIGTDFLDLFSEQTRQRFVAVIIKASRGIPTTNFEVEIPRRGGGATEISFNITSVLDPYGKVQAVISVGQDLTEVRRLQSQMLHSERLVTIGQLSAGVVHEINNPLTSIAVYSEALLQKAVESGAQEQEVKRLERIHQSAERIYKFTQQLMAYARPTAEEPTLVDLRDVANKSIGFCEHILYKAGVSVVREYSDETPPVYGIEGQLEQVFVNLITNSCQAMKGKGGKLTIRIEKGREGTISVQVSDEGHGIDPQGLKQIFEPFYTTKVEGEGTGLGLSIVKNIVTAHEGDISVMSELGKGTTFILTLYTSE